MSRLRSMFSLPESSIRQGGCTSCETIPTLPDEPFSLADEFKQDLLQQLERDRRVREARREEARREEERRRLQEAS